ncbi:hypothetical protein LY90DRAFT_675413 [Neocallimastix californiae]|uniref:DUF4211 domain-containing protein n=1 Tax=Neocallimastix californiae TaxID=1754190 RepID=A0A1Y2AMT3_9FUNG|nr:hypothetical protein LY90DRAFT_675413 [Neocallimastix californiae]|eukprot:ORY23869.1 hypothetical protein LY90DRAFT_675413 [Neocallimastix californiae]
MELRKRNPNISYNNFLNGSQETLNNKSESDNISSITQKNDTLKLNLKKNNKKKKVNSDSEYEDFSSSNDNESEELISSDESRNSATKGKQKKNKKKNKTNFIDSDYDSDDSKEDVIANSAYDPIIQQNVTIVTPLRIIKKMKFNNIINEIVDLIGDSDEELETVTIISSDDSDYEPLKQNGQTKQNDIIDLCLDEDDNDENLKSYNSTSSKNQNQTSSNTGKISDEESDDSDEEISIVKSFKKRNRSSNKMIFKVEETSDEETNKNTKRQKISNYDNEEYNDNDNSDNVKEDDDDNFVIDDEIGINDDDYNEIIENDKIINISDSSKENNTGHYLRSRSKNSNSSQNEELNKKNKNEIEINTKDLKDKDLKNNIDYISEPNSNNTNFLIELESMTIDDQPSGSIRISSDDDSSDDDIVEIVSNRNVDDQIEISDDDNYIIKKQKKFIDSLPQSSMKKSIEQRLSRKKKKDQNRLLDLKRIKERKRKPIDSINPYEDVIGNNGEDDINNDIISTTRYLDKDDDDFIVSDSGDEQVYFLTTEWDVKQRKKLYKSFKRLFRFCINIIIGGNYIKENINNLKKSFQVINKRINYVCKKITPVPPWVKDFQNHVDSYPYLTVTSHFPLSKCDSCDKDTTSSFSVSFSGRKYNKLSLRETNDNALKDKEVNFVIDRVCLERVQIYHELYHFKYNTLKSIEKKMKEEGLNIKKLKASTDENKIENTFEQLKPYCKELYVKLSDKLKFGENYIPNTLDI